jgi:hypothetical protein
VPDRQRRIARFVPVGHEGNQNRSDEEAEVVEKVVKGLLGSGTSWVDMKGVESSIRTNPARAPSCSVSSATDMPVAVHFVRESAVSFSI